VTLCKYGVPSCHEKAEADLHNIKTQGFSKEDLYKKINSSFEKAKFADENDCWIFLH
jgi:hypothetical protein